MNRHNSAHLGMHLACLHQAGARRGSRASATLGIQEGNLTLYVIIGCSPMQKQFTCTKRSTRSEMNLLLVQLQLLNDEELIGTVHLSLINQYNS